CPMTDLFSFTLSHVASIQKPGSCDKLKALGQEVHDKVMAHLPWHNLVAKATCAISLSLLNSKIDGHKETLLKTIAEEAQKKSSQPNLAALAIEDLLKKYTDEVVSNIHTTIAELKDEVYCKVHAKSLDFEEALHKKEIRYLVHYLVHSATDSYNINNTNENVATVSLAAKEVVMKKATDYVKEIRTISTNYLSDLAYENCKSTLSSRSEQFITAIKKFSQNELQKIDSLLLQYSEAKEKELDGLSSYMPKVILEVLNFLEDIEGRDEHAHFLSLFTKEVASLRSR
ncbi:MAG: hypothetical protein JSR46_07220, partial [Verrucomicrobia bacterium]|nr:hypothetical protein [Verrucomicrobiota bacterium]